MIQGIPLSVVLAVIIALFFVVDFYFMSQYVKERSEGGKKGWAWNYTLFIMGIGLAVLLQPIVLPSVAWSTDAPLGFFVQCVGGVSVLLSFVLHIWSRVHLRHYYTERIEVQANHQVINTGPYAYVRHPFITSLFLLSGGIVLLNPAITTTCAFIYIVIDFTKASKKEEDLLSKSIQGYAQYLKQVPRFVPNLWKK